MNRYQSRTLTNGDEYSNAKLSSEERKDSQTVYLLCTTN